MKKQILAIIFVLALSLTMLAGCGGGSGTGTDNGGSPTSSPAGSTTSSPADNGGNQDVGMAWPSGIPSDVPQMDGTIISVNGDDINTGMGMISVKITVSGKDAVKAYVDNLVSKGFEKLFDNDDGTNYQATAKSSSCNLTITYDDDTKTAGIIVAANK